jgi:hypothetical protein
MACTPRPLPFRPLQGVVVRSGGIGGAYHELADAPRSAQPPRATDPAGQGIGTSPREGPAPLSARRRLLSQRGGWNRLANRAPAAP